MKDTTKIVVMKVILRRKIRLSGKIATLVFGESVGIAPQCKQKRNVRAIKEWRLFAILIFRVYFLRPRETDTYFRNIIFSNISEILFMCITDYFKLFSRSCAIKTLSKEFEFV